VNNNTDPRDSKQQPRQHRVTMSATLTIVNSDGRQTLAMCTEDREWTINGPVYPRHLRLLAEIDRLIIDAGSK
jgi:hypothetical protein